MTLLTSPFHFTNVVKHRCVDDRLHVYSIDSGTRVHADTQLLFSDVH